MGIILNIFSEMGNITGLVTFSITIFGALSLVIANLARYLQAQKFGIPIKMAHAASIADSICRKYLP